jgi:hypothetical protein
VVIFTPRPLYPRGKSNRQPLDRTLGGPQSRSGRREANSWLYRDSNSDPSVVQLVASRYTDYAIPAPCMSMGKMNNTLINQRLVEWTCESICLTLMPLKCLSWETKSSGSGIQETARLLRSPKFHPGLQKRATGYIPSPMNPVYIFTPISCTYISILSSHLRLDLQSSSFPSRFPVKMLYAFLVSLVYQCPKFRSSPPAWFDHSNPLKTEFIPHNI